MIMKLSGPGRVLGSVAEFWKSFKNREAAIGIRGRVPLLADSSFMLLMSDYINASYRATQLVASLTNKPGTLAQFCSMLGDAGVDITAILAPEAGNRGKVRVIVDDPNKAKIVLKKAKIRFSEEEVIIVEMYNRPGVFGKLAAKLAESKIDILFAYASTSPYAWTKVVLAVPDVSKALRLIG